MGRGGTRQRRKEKESADRYCTKKVSLRQNFIHPGIFWSVLLPNRKTPTPVLWTQEGRIPFKSAARGCQCAQSLGANNRDSSLSHSEASCSAFFFLSFFCLTIELTPLLRVQHCFDRPRAPAWIAQAPSLCSQQLL